MFCNDWAVPVTGYRKLRKHLKRAAARAPGMLFSPSTLSSVNSCLGWNRGTANPQAPLPPARTGPVLLVSARHDPATPYAWARNVARQLGPQASRLTYEGWGHVVYGRSDCVNAAVDRYLIELRSSWPRGELPRCRAEAGRDRRHRADRAAPLPPTVKSVSRVVHRTACR
nr:hypothetical protein GCM10020092_027360 [Actinoplanes digitatis]